MRMQLQRRRLSPWYLYLAVSACLYHHYMVEAFFFGLPMKAIPLERHIPNIYNNRIHHQQRRPFYLSMARFDDWTMKRVQPGMSFQLPEDGEIYQILSMEPLGSTSTDDDDDDDDDFPTKNTVQEQDDPTPKSDNSDNNDKIRTLHLRQWLDGSTRNAVVSLDDPFRPALLHHLDYNCTERTKDSITLEIVNGVTWDEPERLQLDRQAPHFSDKQGDWIVPGMPITVVLWKGRVLDWILPETAEYTVQEIRPPQQVREGNATGSSSIATGITVGSMQEERELFWKTALVLDGMEVSVPPEVEKGDHILVDIDDQEFVDGEAYALDDDEGDDDWWPEPRNNNHNNAMVQEPEVIE